MSTVDSILFSIVFWINNIDSNNGILISQNTILNKIESTVDIHRKILSTISNMSLKKSTLKKDSGGEI